MAKPKKFEPEKELNHLGQLDQELDRLINKLPDGQDFRRGLGSLTSLYPFNKYEYIISKLLGAGVLQLDEYIKLRNAYIADNELLHIFEISAPRGFGEKWAQTHLSKLVPTLAKPSEEHRKQHPGNYDFHLNDKIRTEVKASRAVDKESSEPLHVKALSSDSVRPFVMNFQQIKPDCFDVLIWIGVWRDIIRYWVLSSYEAQERYSDKQHYGNKGEGQFHMHQNNMSKFDNFVVVSDQLENAIRKVYEREQKQRNSPVP